jgi:adenosylmethionine-8-amino-7-oxononanoate aminotransferase
MAEQRAADLWEADLRHVWHPYTSFDTWAAEPAPILERAEHIWLTDTSGRRFIDGSGSWWVSNLGHGYPPIRAAMHRQLDRMAHVIFGGATHEPAIRLAELLSAVAPPGLTRTFFSDNGSTAVEVAVRAAFEAWRHRGDTRRRRFVSLEGAYHGDTIGTASLGGIESFRRSLDGLLFEALHVPTGGGEAGTGWAQRMVEALGTLLAERGDEVAGVVIEPLILGSAGMRMYSPAILRRIAELTRAAGAYLIADEVFVGMGRTGSLFACEQAGITPDFVCLSKGLTGGFLPFAVTLTTEEVFERFRGEPGRMFHYGHSYCANPLGCAAALATLEAFSDGSILAGVAERAAEADRLLEPLRHEPGVTEVRRTGLVIAVQLGEQASYEQPVGRRIARRARERGLLMRPLGNVVYLVPALTITRDELAQLLGLFGDSIRDELRAG